MSPMDIPEKVIQAFADRSTLSLPELAPAVEIDVKALRKHRLLGNLPVRIKGFGVERRHYVCTLADVATFYQNLQVKNAPCPIEQRIPRSGSLTSRSKIIDFPAQRNAGMNVTLRRSKKTNVPKPSESSKRPSHPEAGR